MTVSILVDLLISAPVVVFLLWLYARTAPDGPNGSVRWLDRGCGALLLLLGLWLLQGALAG